MPALHGINTNNELAFENPLQEAALLQNLQAMEPTAFAAAPTPAAAAAACSPVTADMHKPRQVGFAPLRATVHHKSSGTEQALQICKTTDCKHAKRAAKLHKRLNSAAAQDRMMSSLHDIATVERERLLLLAHAKHSTPWETVTSWRGTALKWASKTIRFRASMLIFIVLRLMVIFGLDATYDDVMPDVDFSRVATVGTFLSLFLVFFSSTCFQRFEVQYRLSMAVKGRIHDICLLAINCFEQSGNGRAAAHRLMRHVNATHALACASQPVLGLSSNCSPLFCLQPLMCLSWPKVVVVCMIVHAPLQTVGSANLRSRISSAVSTSFTKCSQGRSMPASRRSTRMAQAMRVRITVYCIRLYYNSIHFEFALPFGFGNDVRVFESMARSVCRCTDKETIGWCLRDVQEEADAGRVGVDGVAFQMRLQVLELRDNIGQIYDFLAQVRIYQKHLALAAPMHTRLQCYSVM